MRRIATALLCLGVLVGCAQPGAEPSAAGSAADADWVTYQADVTAVRVSDDPRSLVLTVALLGDADGCSRDPRIEYFVEENNHIFANVVQDSRLSAVVGACPTHTPGEVRLTAPGPIDGRIVVLNQHPWKPDGDEYHPCDATFGCDPMPADHCDRAWIDVAVGGLDVSRHSVGSVEGCDGTWLVMTVPFDPVPCGAEARSGCDPSTNVRRYFLRWSDQPGWRMITSSTQAGCGSVHTVEPAFPGKLCADLPRP
ncbi:hypothetical protein [Micromonospora eburnea]|uniref:Lipoprotein n=1 Tax=Micromonospora eburnea TaxID=227316 RepID=A0A1C6V371_9ACTN|nr:hypothetical protein [Micromonospora eburnea]SCL60567.1 hypothetical protein GA0070604_4324 [Micromonospora eburnea]